MKEIWKLIELLNEYNEGGHWRDENFDANKLLVISKKYGFIKWLVENDKIDIDKVIDTAKSSVIDTYYYEEGIDDIYIPLLMVLAVEDEPIEFLISILK